MRRHLRPLRRIALLLLLAACGSRTGLFNDEGGGSSFEIDAGFDGSFRRDGSFESDADVLEDALPPLDVRPPEDVVRNDCPDSAATLVYVVTASYELYSFNPSDGSFRAIGNIVCPSGGNATPFSMAVNRQGIAFVLYNDGNLFRVSSATAACIATPFVQNQSGFETFGMGFATNEIGPTETLYVAGDSVGSRGRGLARINPQTFVLTPVAQFSPTIERAELTGTGDGRLFAFYTKIENDVDAPTFIGEINTDTAQVIAERRFDDVHLNSAWAFAYWGGDFYMFTGVRGTSSSEVTRYRPADNSVGVVATLPSRIVGAGVSTCAPQQ